MNQYLKPRIARFKPGLSTTQCTFAVNEVIQYYTNNASSVYAVMLDASKAFDRVEYVKLFRLLLDRGLCPTIARFLLNMYTHQTVRVRWCNNTTVSNGVKPGGVLSPIMFTVYMDELFNRLARAGVGNLFAGAFGYADDETLLEPTKYSMTVMLKVVSQYGKEFQVKFNPSKSKLTVFGNNCTYKDTIMFDGSVIESELPGKHLGNPLGPYQNKTFITGCVNDFTGRVNVLCDKLHNKAMNMARNIRDLDFDLSMSLNQG